MWRASVPVVILVAVGAVQIALAKTAMLTPWKGGGFGMFSTTDSADGRALTIVVSGPKRSEELTVPDSLQDAARRAAALPADRQLRSLARRLIDRERRHDRSADTVRIRCWRTVFDREMLHATRQLLRDFTYDDRRDGLPLR